MLSLKIQERLNNLSSLNQQPKDSITNRIHKILDYLPLSGFLSTVPASTDLSPLATGSKQKIER